MRNTGYKSFTSWRLFVANADGWLVGTPMGACDIFSSLYMIDKRGDNS